MLAAFVIEKVIIHFGLLQTKAAIASMRMYNFTQKGFLDFKEAKAHDDRLQKAATHILCLKTNRLMQYSYFSVFTILTNAEVEKAA